MKRDKNNLTEINTLEGYDQNGNPIFGVVYIRSSEFKRCRNVTSSTSNSSNKNYEDKIK